MATTVCNAVVFLDEGKLLVAGTNDGELLVWEMGKIWVGNAFASGLWTLTALVCPVAVLLGQPREQPGLAQPGEAHQGLCWSHLSAPRLGPAAGGRWS